MRSCWFHYCFVILLFVLVPAAWGQSSASSDSWAPPDIDNASLPTTNDVPCPLNEVLGNASRRVQELVENMQRFTAKEQAEFEEVDQKGVSRGVREARFNYVAYISEISPQNLNVEEYRNDSVNVENFPSKLATVGTAAFALIFHPNYVNDFSAACEGQTDWKGRKAWRLHLVQTKANNFRGYRQANRYFPVMLKARAWIDAESFQVLRLETNLRDPIPALPLLLEAVTVDYANVDFPKRNLQLWLPQSAEIYMDYRGHRYHHKHHFSDFQLFWVDTTQSVKVPKQ